LSEQLGDQYAQGEVLLDPPMVTTGSALDRPAVRFERPVLAVSAAVTATRLIPVKKVLTAEVRHRFQESVVN
jgi:hypothetical protein